MVGLLLPVVVVWRLSETRNASRWSARALQCLFASSADHPLTRCWEEGCLYDTWDYRAKPLDGVTICCSGQGPGRKAGLRSAATLLGADWVDELDKRISDILTDRLEKRI